MRRSSRLAALIGAPALAAGAAAAIVLAAPGQAATPRSATVQLGSSRFMPARVVVARGGTVTWRWANDGIKHNVTWTTGRPAASSSTKASGTYRVRFSRAGTYKYVCTIHAGIGMVGTVVVR